MDIRTVKFDTLDAQWRTETVANDLKRMFVSKAVERDFETQLDMPYVDLKMLARALSWSSSTLSMTLTRTPANSLIVSVSKWDVSDDGLTGVNSWVVEAMIDSEDDADQFLNYVDMMDGLDENEDEEFFDDDDE